MSMPSSTLVNTANEPPGMQFVVTTPSQRRGRDQQRQVRSHATRARPRRKGTQELTSWVKREPSTNGANQSHVGIPSRVGTDLSWIQFAETMRPYMLEGVVRFLTIVRDGLYPPEICLQVNSIDTAWVGYMLKDQVYLHSMLYSAEAYFDQCSGREKSMRTHFHLLKSLGLLQERLSHPEDTLATSDATIMTVVTLALTAEVLEQGESVSNHIEGLKEMLNMRGGFAALRSSTHELPTKICRVDLAHSIRFSQPPTFFRRDISWHKYLPETTLKSKATTSAEKTIATFIGTLDAKLANVWSDLRQFSRISNLGYQTGRKLTSETYSEIMVSVLYRLLHQTFESNIAHEALRVGMLTFSAAIFFRWEKMRQGQKNVSELFRRTLERLQSFPGSVPDEVILWLLMVWYTSASWVGEGQCGNWLARIMASLQVASWEQAKELLKSAIWIDALHDQSGRQCLEKILKP